jgi:hypothetical protein
MTAHNHAIAAFLWSEGSEPGTRISNDLQMRIAQDWDRFRDAAEDLGFDAVEHRATTIDPTEGDEWDYAAHDFILTRNHHGAGFWDGDWVAPWGDRLTALAQTFPQLESYLDDNKTLQLY